MNCTVQMINCFTGEIYYTKELGYAFHLSNKKDVGMTKVREVIESAIKGARIKEEPIQVRLMFSEIIESQNLPFPKEDVE